MGTLYSKMKVFHFKEKLDSLPRDKAMLPPLHIRIKPTNACNHRCGYCAYRADNLQLGQDMREADAIPREKMLEIVDDIIAMGVRAVTFSGGGEPLAYKHLTEVLDRLAASPVRFATLTNGALLSGPVAKLFAQGGSWVRLSMDGFDAASYAAYRSVGLDAFAGVMANIEAFKALGGPCLLGVSYIVDEKNAGHVFDMVRRIRDAGADSIKISPCIVANEGTVNNAYHARFFDTVRDQVDRAKAAFETDGFEIFDAYHKLEEAFDKDYDWCPFSQVLPVIGADCNIYPCQDKAYNLETGLLGTIRDKRFKDFWAGAKDAFFKVVPSTVCRHHCVANAKNRLILDYLGVDPDHLGFV